MPLRQESMPKIQTMIFLPSTGKLIANQIEPKDGIRWDSGVEAGMVIGTDFDPMMAKVIAHGSSRLDASRKLAKELESTHFGGFYYQYGILGQYTASQRVYL